MKDKALTRTKRRLPVDKIIAYWIRIYKLGPGNPDRVIYFNYQNDLFIVEYNDLISNRNDWSKIKILPMIRLK